MRRIFLFCFSGFLFVFTSAQQLGVDFFYCENTLVPTYMEDKSGIPLKIEIPLNTNVSINSVPLFCTLLPNNSLVGVTTFPTDFSASFKKTIQITNGGSTRDVLVSAKKISKRNAPFILVFTDRFTPSDWVSATSGWLGIGLGASIKDVILDNDNAAFILAYNGAQGLLSFDISGNNLPSYQGIFAVEVSVTGVDDWEPLYVLDNCQEQFKSDSYTISLKLNQESQFIRISSKTGENKQEISLNNFNIKAYNGETVDNPTGISLIPEELIHLKSNIINAEIQVVGIQSIINGTYKIFSSQGILMQRGKLINDIISVSNLRPGVYFIELNTESQKVIKFIKK
jgi:hypothetical protein